MPALYNLVGDLGGTNVRLGLCAANSTDVNFIEKFSLRDFEDIDHVIGVYLRSKLESGDISISACCLAIAGPIINNKVKMTNTDWEFSTDTLRKNLKIQHAALINDFAAIAHSVPRLKPQDTIEIGQPLNGEASGPIAVVGPGTGLGAALLIPKSTMAGTDSHLIISTEGGHAALSARTTEELQIFSYWRDKGCRINREFFVCGAGIERIYEALCVAASSTDYKNRTVVQIQQLGCSRQERLCEQAMEVFCALLGSAAGDQVLCTGSTGGVVLAGGILPKFVEFLQQSAFRQRFESKGAMSHFMSTVPSHLIIEAQPGLIGAAAYLLEKN